MARLIMMSGLPGSGKSTLSRRLAAYTGARLLRIDIFEQDLRNRHGADFDVETLGYEHGYGLAAAHLRDGGDVIADAVNAVEAARQGWRDVAAEAGAGMVEVEIICSNTHELRERLQTRNTGIAGLAPVSWTAVRERKWEHNPHLLATIDTAGRTIDQCAQDLERIVRSDP